MEKVEIPLRLRDFQVQWESPAFGLFHGAAFSTALLPINCAIDPFFEAQEHHVAVIVRVAFDESALTGKLTESTQFAEGDIRGRYFAGDRLARTVRRVEVIN